MEEKKTTGCIHHYDRSGNIKGFLPLIDVESVEFEIHPKAGSSYHANGYVILRLKNGREYVVSHSKDEDQKALMVTLLDATKEFAKEIFGAIE